MDNLSTIYPNILLKKDFFFEIIGLLLLDSEKVNWVLLSAYQKYLHPTIIP